MTEKFDAKAVRKELEKLLRISEGFPSGDRKTKMIVKARNLMREIHDYEYAKFDKEFIKKSRALDRDAIFMSSDEYEKHRLMQLEKYRRLLRNNIIESHLLKVCTKEDFE